MLVKQILQLQTLYTYGRKLAGNPARLNIPVNDFTCTLTSAAPNSEFNIVPTAMMATEAKKETEYHERWSYHAVN